MLVSEFEQFYTYSSDKFKKKRYKVCVDLHDHA